MKLKLNKLKLKIQWTILALSVKVNWDYVRVFSNRNLKSKAALLQRTNCHCDEVMKLTNVTW